MSGFVGDSDLPKLSSADRLRLLEDLESWSFEPLSMSEHGLLACVLFLFQVIFRIQGMRDVIDLDMSKSLLPHSQNNSVQRS